MTGEKNSLAYLKYFSFFLSLVLLIFSYLIVLGPKYNQVKSLNIQEKEKKLNDSNKYLEDLKVLKINYERLSFSDLKRLEQFLPKQKDIPGIFVQLDSFMKKNKLVLLSLDVSEEKALSLKTEETPKNAPQKLKISLNIAGGDYLKLKSLLSDIENNLRLFDLNSFSFSPDSKSYSLNLSAYYLK